jgi:peptidoglycan/LPS O-acetylase OafA/YrhL
MAESDRGDETMSARASRPLFTFAAIVIGVILALAWMRSYWVSDGVFWKDKRVMLRVMSSRGGMLVGYWRSVGTQDFPPVGLGYSRRLPRDVAEMAVRPEAGAGHDWRWSRLGFVIERDRGSSVRGGLAIVLYWMVLLVGGIAVLGKRLVWRPVVRRRRRRRGRCETCGYDLRGSAERCPECGRAIGQVAQQ